MKSTQQVSYVICCIPFPYLPGTTQSLVIKPMVLSDGVVPGEAKFAKEAGLTSWFSTVVCRGAIRNVLTGNFSSKGRLSVGFTGKIEFGVN